MENWLVWKNTCFFGVFDQNLGPKKFHFSASKNGQKRPNEWGSGKSFKKMLPGILSTNAMLIVFLVCCWSLCWGLCWSLLELAGACWSLLEPAGAYAGACAGACRSLLELVLEPSGWNWLVPWPVHRAGSSDWSSGWNWLADWSLGWSTRLALQAGLQVGELADCGLLLGQVLSRRNCLHSGQSGQNGGVRQGAAV